ncbi:hypothetical protein GCM10020331_028450 [Ectobacillus funiculus]
MNTNRMMKAAIINEFKQQLEIKEVPIPEIGYGEVLVKIKACGVCHTDLHAAHGDWPIKPKLPLIPGHEGVGIVEEVGPGVTSIKKRGMQLAFLGCTPLAVNANIA